MAILLDAIKTTDVFGKLDERPLQEFVSLLERVILPGGARLFRQGDPSDEMYVVVRGGLQVTITQADGHEVCVAERGPGSLVGEMQILSGGLRSANVDARGETELLKVPKAAFEKLVAQAPEVVEHIATLIRQRFRRQYLEEVLPSLFGPLDEQTLNHIETQIEWVHLQRGEVLVRQGEATDSLYIVISGRLDVLVSDPDGHERVVNQIARGEYIGETTIFTGEPRTASLYAARDSELAKLAKPAFEALVQQYPQALMSLAKLVFQRFNKMQRSAIRSPQVPRTVTNIAILCVDPEERDFADRLRLALSALGTTLHVSSERLERLLGTTGVAQIHADDPHQLRLSTWLDEQETRHCFVIYEADRALSNWTQRCLRQADQVLIVGQASANPVPGELEKAILALEQGTHPVRKTLVLMHPNGQQRPAGTHQWCARHTVERVHHLRRDTPADFERLARFLAGQAVGLALGGGGARGFAHIGVIRALQEAGIPIDMVGGTSMGALIAALCALGLDADTMVRTLWRDFVRLKPSSDYTLPLMGLSRGRRTDQGLKMMFHDTQIEDLWLNYFCVSTDLTTAEMVLHHRGPLWKAIRASCSVPAILVPVIEGGHVLVDGGVMNNLPSDVMRECCGGTVIAVDVSPDVDLSVSEAYESMPSPWEILWRRVNPFQPSLAVPNIIEIVSRAMDINNLSKKQRIASEADLVLRPPVQQFRLLELAALDKIVAAGYDYAREKIAAWQRSASDS